MVMALTRIVHWSIVIGAISFAVGFFGPMILAPDANQGPLLGIVYTGPLGVVVGFVVGVGRELLGYRDGPVETFARLGFTSTRVLRGVAVVGGVWLAFYGIKGLRDGEGRGAAAALVIGCGVAWYGVTGNAPNWLRR